MIFSFLILDDEKKYRIELEEIINAMDIGSKILTASNHDSGLEKAVSIGFDVFLADIDLRGEKNGLDFIKEIKKKNPLSQIIIVSSNPDYRKEALDLKVSGYIDKPYKPEQVIREINSVLIYAKEMDNQMITFKRQEFEKRYKARDIICVRKVPKTSRKVIVTAYKTQTESSEEMFSIKSNLDEVPKMFLRQNTLIRVHQSWLVNPRHVIDYDLAYDKLILTGDIRVPIGDHFRDNILPLFQNERGGS